MALAGSGGAFAQARTYALDPVHTRVMFAVDHAGFSRAIGTVSGSTGTLSLDPDDWSSARVEAWIPLERLELGDAVWNRATLAVNLLDAGRHPYAVFVSDRVEPLPADDGAARARVHGMLTLRGVSSPVVLEVTMNALKRHPLPPFRRTAGFSAVATLKRSDFGITAWRSMIGEEVELRIEAEATYAPRASFATRPGDAPPAVPPSPLPDEDADDAPVLEAIDGEEGDDLPFPPAQAPAPQDEPGDGA